MTDERLTRQQISAAVGPLGWRFIMAGLRTMIAVDSIAQAAAVASHLTTAAGNGDRAAQAADAGRHLQLDLRPDAVIATLSTPEAGWVTATDIELARRLTTAAAEHGLTTDARTGARASQVVEVAIDALDAATIRPFWLAVLNYVSQPGSDGDTDPIVDPYAEGPSFWFQQMDAPRPQRNRIHLDISVPHDEAPARIAATVAAGGTVVYDAEAPAFWVLADAEGNEACICTWQGRDG